MGSVKFKGLQGFNNFIADSPGLRAQNISAGVLKGLRRFARDLCRAYGDRGFLEML